MTLSRGISLMSSLLAKHPSMILYAPLVEKQIKTRLFYRLHQPRSFESFLEASTVSFKSSDSKLSTESSSSQHATALALTHVPQHYWVNHSTLLLLIHRLHTLITIPFPQTPFHYPNQSLLCLFVLMLHVRTVPHPDFLRQLSPNSSQDPMHGGTQSHNGRNRMRLLRRKLSRTGPLSGTLVPCRE